MSLPGEMGALGGGARRDRGQNNGGQLGLGDTVFRGGTPATMGDNLPAVDLGTGRHAVKLSPMGAGGCTVLDDNAFKCWGSNGGKLGLGDTNNRGDNPGEMGDNLPAVVF